MIKQNVSLKKYNSFNIDVKAKEFVEINSKEELIHIVNVIKNKKVLFLGGGSNILFTKDFDGIVIHLNMKGIKYENSNSENTIVKANAGENWNKFVELCLENNLGGIENLSLIPGNVGSAPVQNIGAYGVELESVFYSCNAISIDEKQLKKFKNEDCQFSYRNSIFKEKLKNKYIITNVVFRLTKLNHKLNISYKPLRELLQKENISKPTIKNISDLVKKIRQSKLPDPKVIGNCGSFFKNPIVSRKKFESLKLKHSLIPYYLIDEGEYKIPAAWLIEKCGFKGIIDGKTGTHKNHSLVIINQGGATGKEIYNFSQKIKKSVLKKFNILLEEEVNIFE